jgi:hypothetical protein
MHHVSIRVSESLQPLVYAVSCDEEYRSSDSVVLHLQVMGECILLRSNSE